MKNYYFLATILPKIQIGLQPEITFEQFMTLLKENLSPADYDKTKRLRWLFDIRNVKAFWKGEPLDYWGNLNADDLEEALLAREGKDFPPYVFDFLNEYESKSERLKHFPQLLSDYFAAEAEEETGFLRDYANFERNLRLITTAYRAHQLGRDLSVELQYEDPEEDLVAQLLAQKDAKNFEPPPGYEDLKPIIDKYYKEPLELHKALCEYVFNYIEDRLVFDEFSINRILGYMIQFIMAERWMKLDKEKGLTIVNNIVKDMT